uniref:Uncharacterized protein n=1 Tax=Cannabis sativa TaxID=3483 RepID=A0A803P4N6_CANSA
MSKFLPPTTTGLTNQAHTVNSVNLPDPPNTTNPINPTNTVNPSDPPLTPRADPPTEPRTKGLVNTEQPIRSETRFGPRYYPGETKSGIGEPAIGEPHVDLGENIKHPLLATGRCQSNWISSP